MGTQTITPERLRELLSYDPQTGHFAWLAGKQGRRLGRVLGANNQHRYLRINVEGVKHYAHRLAWLHTYGRWPTQDIDHINGDGRDNRIANLRQATPSQNLANVGPQKRNRSGLKGVHQHSNGQWRAQIQVRKQRIHIGLFNSPEDAADAYGVAAQRYFGEFARTTPALTGGV